jgi:hypothetical protein
MRLIRKFTISQTQFYNGDISGNNSEQCHIINENLKWLVLEILTCIAHSGDCYAENRIAKRFWNISMMLQKIFEKTSKVHKNVFTGIILVVLNSLQLYTHRILIFA